MQRYKQGATTLMENQDGLERRHLLETRGRVDKVKTRSQSNGRSPAVAR
jgi:hypothetical protein